MAKRTGKQNRLQQLTSMLKTHPEGLRKADIARRLGVHRSTVGRYIDQLSLNLPLWERDSLIGLENSVTREEIPQFNLYEGSFLLLLVRLYQQELNIKNPHASSVIRKLASGFKISAPELYKSLTEAAENIDLRENLIPRSYVSNFERLSNAWVNKQTLMVSYLHKTTGESCKTFFEPRRFFINKPTVKSSEMSVYGLCRRARGFCTLRVGDFSEIEYPEVNYGYYSQNEQFCPISEFALSKRPVVPENKAENLIISESNHRIKNNLFMVSGLVEVTFSDIDDPEIQFRSRQLQSRIDVIAQIHAQLTLESDSELIDLNRFINELVDKIVFIAAPHPQLIKKRIKVGEIRLTSTKVLPLGMIISELITNSFKYALRTSEGVLSLSVTGVNGTVRFRYSDGGSGFDPDKDENACGSKLIKNFCKQLGCNFIFKNKFFILEFPV